MRKILLCLIVAPVLFGCNKAGGCSEKEYVAVGIMGMIPTGTAYLITEKEARKDSTIPISFFQPAAFETKIKGRQLTTIEFEKAKEILSNLPAQFFTDDKTVYGCPNCADGGAIFIKGHKDGKLKTMTLEWSPGTYPAYLNNYMIELKQILLQL